MARSNAPQALSVVSVTHEGNVPLTVQEIIKFDTIRVGFSHARTWASMPAALMGAIDPEGIDRQLSGAHPRVAKSIAALCRLGKERPVRTHALRDHPEAGIREIEGLRVGPEVTIAAKATCWFVRDGHPIIPILQPRLSDLGLEKLGIYAALAKRAFCRGDWADAEIEMIDLSGSAGDKVTYARVIPAAELPVIGDDRLIDFLQTFTEAQRQAQKVRAARAAEQPVKPEAPMPLFPDHVPDK